MTTFLQTYGVPAADVGGRIGGGAATAGESGAAGGGSGSGGDPHAVDKTAHEPARADLMSRDTYAWLVRASGSRTHVPWKILQPYVERFNRALRSEKDRILEDLERQLGER